MEDNLNICFKWKTTSILFQMEDNLNFVQTQLDEIWKTTPIFFLNGRRPQFFKGKTNSIILRMEEDLNFLIMEDNLEYLKMEDNLIFFENGRGPQLF